MLRDKEYKGYLITDGSLQTRKIKAIGKGALPKSLRGMFSSSAAAQHAIDTHLLKGATDGTKVSTARG